MRQVDRLFKIDVEAMRADEVAQIIALVFKDRRIVKYSEIISTLRNLIPVLPQNVVDRALPISGVRYLRIV